MTTDPGMSRRVTRLENDTESIYELITEVRSTLDEHSGRLASVGTSLTEHTGRFDRIDTALAELLRRLPDAS